MPDFPEIFGSDYTYALNLIEQNEWWADTLQAHGLDPAFALSVIFPELIRYSSILDYVETRSLEVLYVRYGRDYADFSIGYFQMKPSFAERIEADILNYNLDKLHSELSFLKSTLVDEGESRKQRVLRLKDEYCQLLYLEAFFRIMDYKYSENIQKMPMKMKLAFYSTAYNTGYFKDIRVIGDEISKKRLYSGLNPEAVKYCYSEIALSYFIMMMED